MHPLSLLIKPVSSQCNIQCGYCFYRNVSSSRQTTLNKPMSDMVMEQLVDKACSFASSSCTFAFQGGEPTLAGLPYFEKFVDRVRKHCPTELKTQFVLQTNALNLSDDMLRFFKDNGFLLGISLDGPAELHNMIRRDNSGRGTFVPVMETITRIQEAGIEFNILSVVTNRSVRFVKEIYTFFKNHGFRFIQFIPCLPPLPESRMQGVQPFPLSAKSYGTFLIDLFNLWYTDLMAGQYTSIRQFDNYLLMLLRQPPEACDMGGRCSVQYVIESDGNIYPCDFFALDKYLLGNITALSFEEIDRQREKLRFIDESVELGAQCKACHYLPLCRGGCKRHRLMASGSMEDLTHNYFCKAFTAFFEVCGSRLVHAAELMKHQTQQ